MGGQGRYSSFRAPQAAIAERVRQHRDAGADHVCIQVMTDREGLELPREQWRRLAEALT